MKEFGMVLLGFLSGAVMYSYWLPKVVFKVDVREGTTDQNPVAIMLLCYIGH